MDNLNLVEIFEKTVKKKYVPKKCEHGKRKSRCVECGGSEICEHGKRKSRCTDCGNGSELCEHKRIRTVCIECRGSQICEHQKIRTRCIDCKGSQICEHKKLRALCVDCDGSQICEHKIPKYRCKDCKGSQICEHSREKSKCKKCGGSRICKHGKRKEVCIECNGSSICEHKKIRANCVDCDGSSICEHKKKRANCVDCDGSSICEHKKIRANCVDCDGSRICEHNKNKYYCKQCDGRALCKSLWCETFAKNKYEGYCLFCFVNTFPDKPITRNYKTKEKAVSEKILESFPNFTWVLDKKIEDGCSRRRPDFLLDMGSHIIIVEVDENQHRDYGSNCETKRLMQISLDLHERPIVFIRFNPDDYINSDGIKIESCWKINHLGIMTVKNESEWNKRIKILIEQINYWINNPSEKTIEIVQLFYS